MSTKKNITDYTKLFGSTFGHISYTCFFIALISGIILAVFYDVTKAADSIQLMQTSNPSALFIRSIHYWSAQFFLMFYVLHIWDHLRKNTEKKVSSGIWLRLTISIVAVLLVMLSGFILKGDTESLQAKRILESLLSDIPVLGSIISFSFLGQGDDLQLPYMHHVATATIFIWIIIIEHVKIIWPQLRTILLHTIPIIFLAFFLPALLNTDPLSVMKGPWYFLGLQELLHYFNSTIWASSIFLVLLILFFVQRFLLQKPARVIKRVFIILSVLYILLILVGYFFRGENWQFSWPWDNSYFNSGPLNNSAVYFSDYDIAKEIPIILGRREGCIYCHADVKGFSDAHKSQAIGCSSCHGGNPYTISKSPAHQAMIKIPGNLENAEQSCGQADCHPGIPARVNNSIMNTMSGVVSVNRFVFEESDSLNLLNHIERIGHTAADTHLRNLCASCHLGKLKSEYGPIDQLSRGGGCNACHLNYDDSSHAQLGQLKQQARDSLEIKYHPSLSLKVIDEHCFGCHSRSGRISTNYPGWHETTLETTKIPADKKHRLLDDGRVFEFIAADVHHTAGMECIDCHISYELMGDGNLYAHEEDATKIQCTDCHLIAKPNTLNHTGLDAESKKIARLRRLDEPDHVYLVTHKDNIPLINSYVQENGTAYLVGKNTTKKFELKKPAAICIRGKAHDRLTCNACHTAWAPQCIGCHTEYDPKEKGIDHLTQEKTAGKWLEWLGEFKAEAPTLGIIKEGQKEKIETFIPGMVLTIDKSKFDGKNQNLIFKRLYAPTIAHTTSAKGRNCKSCHNNPVALGYGRGKLSVRTEAQKGIWQFVSEYAKDTNDGLPADAWIGFLDSLQGSATRINARPFKIAEQQKILQVGLCLTCHVEDSQIMLKSLDGFDTVLKNVTTQCLLQ